MSDSPALSRKKKVRAAHRVSVTRMIGSAQEMIRGEVATDTAKLRQKRDALAAKAELLNGLDAEIVGEIPEDELETEIENTDAIQERIELTIIGQDSAQTSGDAHSLIPSRTTSREPTPDNDGGRESPGTDSDLPRSKQSQRAGGYITFLTME